MIRVGIVGHRFLKQTEAEFTASQCQAVLKDLLKQYESIVACSAIAEGADSIFATAALMLHMPLEIVLPFAEYEFDFADEKALQTFLTLKAAASKITRLPYGSRSDEAYRAAMQWMLDTCNIVIVAWNGQEQGGPGGTANAVKNIISKGLNWIHIDISDSRTHVFTKKKHVGTPEKTTPGTNNTD